MHDLWFRRFHPSPDAPVRLVCLPHAGGSASYYFAASRRLSGVADVLAVQYPGRQDRSSEPLLETVDALADGVHDALQPWADRPLALFGHSMGASVAYEVALRLDRTSTPPAALFASGRRAPSRDRREEAHLLTDAGLLAEVEALSGTEAAVLRDEEILRMALPALRADYTAAENYRGRSGTVVSCPVHAHVGDADPRVDLDEVRDWGKHTIGRFTFTTHSGGHFYLNDHGSTLLDLVAQELRPSGVQLTSG